MNLIGRKPEICNYSNWHWTRIQVKTLTLVKNTRAYWINNRSDHFTK